MEAMEVIRTKGVLYSLLDALQSAVEVFIHKSETAGEGAFKDMDADGQVKDIRPGIKEVQARLEKKSFRKLSDFEEDLRSLFTSAFESLTPNEASYAFYTSLQAETLRIYQHEITLAKRNKDDKSYLNILFGETWDSRSSRTKPENTEVDFNARTEIMKFALLQASPDGFLFTGIAGDGIADNIKNGRGLPATVTKVAIVPPAPLVDKGIPTLNDLAPYVPKVHAKPNRDGIRQTPVKSLNYGPFASFAPGVDSTSADLSSEDASLALDFKDGITQKPAPQRQDKIQIATSDLTEIHQWLEESGFDLSQFSEDNDMAVEDEKGWERLSEEQVNQMATGDEKMQTFLADNFKLLSELQALQNERFEQNDGKLTDPSDREIQLATTLQKRIGSFINANNTSLQVSEEHFETSISRIIHYENVYRGTLPPTRPFTFEANTIKSELVPETANARPPYNPKGMKPVLIPPILPQVPYPNTRSQVSPTLSKQASSPVPTQSQVSPKAASPASNFAMAAASNRGTTSPFHPSSTNTGAYNAPSNPSPQASQRYLQQTSPTNTFGIGLQQRQNAMATSPIQSNPMSAPQRYGMTAPQSSQNPYASQMPYNAYPQSQGFAMPTNTAMSQVPQANYGNLGMQGYNAMYGAVNGMMGMGVPMGVGQRCPRCGTVGVQVFQAANGELMCSACASTFFG
ncbi:hypothetical protein BZG36_03213 [Bifiguratus adelaidae]|uniref:Uncharacterized protein n=1 Tax=Bifiguratus adelaidae TaxID=1938954 RepID=A0A261Y170_9FUNG|nr:hypothetical protein BZG36_03213 [Bifiguratus adelaidae]